MAAFTARQRAELRDAIARSRLEYEQAHQARHQTRAKRQARQAEYAARFVAQISPYSVVDVEQHAADVARLLVKGLG